MNLKKMETHCEEATSLLKVMAHAQRLMIMCHLVDGEKNVSEILEKCDISQSQLSQFLNRMHREKLLKVRRDGNFSYYSISDTKIVKLIQALQKIFCA
ncbi:MAG: metalloregulator ArsR/SmtB family transcription factor [Bacteriovoracaceae bacterium]